MEIILLSICVIVLLINILIYLPNKKYQIPPTAGEVIDWIPISKERVDNIRKNRKDQGLLEEKLDKFIRYEKKADQYYYVTSFNENGDISNHDYGNRAGKRAPLIEPAEEIKE